MRISPSNGESISKIKKIAPETDSAPRSQGDDNGRVGRRKETEAREDEAEPENQYHRKVLGLSYRSARITTSASVPN